jgi:hypothetical protein
VAFNGWHIDAFPVTSRLQRSKSQALGLGSLSYIAGPDPVTGVTFAALGDGVKHLGIPLSTQPAAAATALHTATLRRWRPASPAGPASDSAGPSVRRQTGAGLHGHLPCHLHTGATKALQSHPQFRRGKPAGDPGAIAALFPGKEVCFRAAADDGIALMDIRAQVLALQAKVVGMLLEPEQLAWRLYFDHWLYKSTAWLTAQEPGTVSARRQHIWQLGRFSHG